MARKPGLGIKEQSTFSSFAITWYPWSGGPCTEKEMITYTHVSVKLDANADLATLGFSCHSKMSSDRWRKGLMYWLG